MPGVINPTVVPLTTLTGSGANIPPGLLTQVLRPVPPVLGPVTQPVPVPRTGGNVVSVTAPTYARYRYLLDQLARLLPGFYASAEWRVNFARGTGLDTKLYDLYQKCGNLGYTTEGGFAPPKDDSRFVMLTNYSPSMALKWVAWVVGTTATLLWIGSDTLPPVKLPGVGPQTAPGPLTGPLTGPVIVPVTGGRGPLGARI